MVFHCSQQECTREKSDVQYGEMIMYDREYYGRYKRLRRKTRVRYTIGLAEISKGKTLNFLDIGCGDGTYSEALERIGHKTVAIDSSPEALYLARKRGISNCVLASATHLPVRSNIFDRTLLIDVFEHLLEPERTLSEIHRTLRPYGLLILQTPNKMSIISLILKDPTHQRIYAKDEVQQLLQSAHFKKVQTMLTSFLSKTYPFNIALRRIFRSIIVATARK